MACQIQTDKYTDVVLDLIKLDSSLYTNFDNAAAFILKSGLSPEQKMMAVHNIAHIYNGLADLDPEYFKKGKVADVINIVTMMENPQEYVQTASEFFNVKKTAPLKVSSIIDKIDALGGMTSVNRMDLNGPDGVLNTIKNYFAVTTFENLDERTKLLESLSASLRGQIIDRADEQDHKDFLLGLIDDTMAGLDKKSFFIPISEIADVAGLDNVLVILKSEQMVEALRENDKLYKLNPDNSLEEIPADQIVSVKDARLSDRSTSNAGEHVFYEDTMLSNFKVVAVNPEESGIVLNKLDEMRSPSSAIRIKAVRISDVADKRIERIQNVDASNKEMRMLANRQHETFENSTQVAYLQSTSNGKVLTLSRPKASEQTFVIVGEIIGSGELFYLYSTENMTFVNSDNSTELVDFTNPVHLKEVQRLSVKDNLGVKSQLSELDLEHMSNAASIYKGFKDSLLPQLQAQFDAGATSVDITTDFKNVYDINQTRGKKSKTVLSSEMVTDPTLSKTLTIFNRDTKQREERKIPFIYSAVEEKEFSLINMLRSNELIEYTNTEGNVRQVSQLNYAELLGLKDNAVKEILKTTDPNQKNLMIKFRPDGTMTYRILENVRQLDQMEEFANFITSLNDVLLSGKQRNKEVESFEKTQFTFLPKTSKTNGDRPLYVSFSTSAQGRLQVEIRPTSVSNRYGFIKEKDPITNKYKNQGQFNFELNETLIVKTASALKGETMQGELIRKIKSEFPALANFDLNKSEELFEFYRTVNNMTRFTSPHPLLQELANKVTEVHAAFAQSLIDNVINKFEEKTAMFPQFMKNLREDFTYDGEFRPYYLVAQPEPDGTFRASISYSRGYTKPKDGVDSLQRFKTNYDNYLLVNAGFLRMNITPKEVVSMSSPAPAVVTAVQVEPVEKVHVNNPAQNITSTEIIIDESDIPEIELFSIADGEIELETEQERLQASEWLSQTYSQLGLSKEDISDAIDLSKVEGTVLGAIKDRVIYLNDKIKSKGVIYHEAFHGVFRYLMSAPQREELINFVRNNKTHSSKFTDAALQEFAKQRNYVYDKERMANLQAEEILADGFQNYMNEGGKPRGIIAKFMQMLKRIIEFFTKHGNYIDNVYGRVKRGYYSTDVINSGIYENETAFVLIPGLKEIIPNTEGTGVAQNVSFLSTEDANQLVYMMAHYFVKDNAGFEGETFEQKFDRIAKHILKFEYNIDRIIANNNNIIAEKPETRDEIIKLLGNTYKQYRFVLGARMLGETIHDINLSGIEAYDKRELSNKVNKTLENNKGEESKKILMNLVKKEYKSMMAIRDGKDVEEDEITPELAEEMFDEDGAPIIKDNDETGTVEEETESEDYDSGYGEHNRLETQSRQIRQFFSSVRYEQYIPELGIRIPRMISGNKLYSLILKLTSDIEPDKSIQHIKTTAETLRMDGFLSTADDLEAIYKQLEDDTKMVNGVPQSNLQLYNMLVDVFDGTEIDYMMTDVKTRENRSDGITTVETYDYTIKDKVLFSDVNKRKKDIVASIITKHAEMGSTEEYKAAVQKLITGINKITTDTKFILSDDISQGDRLNKLTEELHASMAAVGINVPKSLVRLSILAIDKTENMVTHNPDEFQPSVLEHYENHSKFVSEKKYLEKEFFTDMAVIFTKAAKDSHTKFAQTLDDKNTSDTNVNRFNSILGKASVYIIKYDPTELQSTVLNAEGKPIYRYVKHTPATTVAQLLRSKGLEKTLAEDPYFKSQLEDFFKANPMMGGILEKDDSELTKKVEVMLNNFKFGLYGGVAQTFNSKYKQGKSFKNIDDKTMYIVHLLSFLNRTTYRQVVTDKDGVEKEVEVETFMRSFSQLEASQTNFLMTAMYENYANTKGLVKDAAGRIKITGLLEGVVKQEYKRIAREWANREQNKKDFDSRASNKLLLKYNGVLSKEDVTKSNVEDKDLRAYKFNKLADFFKANPELYANTDENGLFDLAKKNTPYEDISEEVKKALLDSLNEFALKSLERHIDVLTKKEVINKITTPTYTKKAVVDPATGLPAKGKTEYYYVPKTDDEGNLESPLEYYTSSLIAPLLKKDSRPAVNIIDNYQKVGVGSFNQVGGIQSGFSSLEGLVQDAFFNFWANSLVFNDLLDGDSAMNVKDSVDYFKRQKKILATGSNMKQGTHRVAVMNTISGYINNRHPEYGPFYSIDEMKEFFANRTDISDEVKEEVINGYGTKEMMYEIFDGQSTSSIMHQMDMYETLGRLTPEIKELLIEKHYRKLNEEEVKLMQSYKIVNNPKKTVTASRNSYHKQSENYIDRNDVSSIEIPKDILSQGSEAIKDYRNQLHNVFKGLYNEIYTLRKQIQDAKSIGEDPSEYVDAIQKKTITIHSFYKPMPHRVILHNLLNAMEYHQIDQLMDTTASKNATMLPIDYFAESKELGDTKPYINLAFSSFEVENRYKYLQVETSGVKDIAKFSVQSKVLIVADLLNLLDIANSSDKEVTESDIKAIERVAEALVEYQETLKEIGVSNLANLKTILRKDGDFDIGKVFNLIRESLESQGAPSSTLKLFDVTPEGIPVHSPNLPSIRNMLEYYFFSQYSKHITDEKGSGFKNIHMSSVGYNVLTDENGKTLLDKEGNIVTTDVYRRNPAKYPNAKFRPLGITTEVKDGITTYYVEAIVPLPFFKSDEHKAFYMKNLSKMFGVRIPTEDKRSMIAMKVVDFIDSSNLTGVIVPHIAHLLAGSDFDVDALYGQTYAHYFNADNKPVIYGNYSAYKSESIGKFVEFVQYMASDKDMKNAVDVEREKISELGDDYVGSTNARLLAGYVSERLVDDEDTLREFDAILDAFEKYGLPVNLENFLAKPDYAKSVRPVYQNANLGSKLKILTNEAVYKFLYISERSSIDRYVGIKDTFGIEEDEVSGQYNQHTIDGVVHAKKTTSMNKTGIGIAARMQKFLALASQYGLELKSEQVIWAFQNVKSTEGDNIEFEMKKYNTFGTLNDDNERVIELNGNILGMFADGAKKPIPAALYMNEANTGVTLAMVGIGLKPEFAFGFNFIPEIRNAVDTVLAVKSAVSESSGNNFIFLNNEVRNELNNLITKNRKEFDALKQLGVITNKSQAYRVVVQRENITMEFEANKLDKEKLNNNTLSSGDIGYKIKAVVKTGSIDPLTNKKADKNSTVDLTEVQQRIVLLQMYADQAQQTFAIGRAGSLLDMFKKLNPKFTTFDKLLNNIIELKDSTDKSIFTEESTKRIFEDNQVWPQLLAAMEDLYEQAGKIFLERTVFFAPIKKLFEPVFTDHSQIAKIITSFVAIRKYQMSMPGSRTSSNEAMNNLIAQDDNNLIETFTAEYPFTNTLGKELEEMQKKYPTNKFLQVLRVDKTENTAVTPSGRNVSESMIKMISRSKAKGKYADEISDDAYILILKENMFMKKLFYHEMLRTGLQYTPGAFLQLLSPDLQLPFSKYINEFIKNLEETKGNRYKLVGALKNSMGPEFTDQDVYSMFDELFLQMAHAATKEVGNNKIKIVDGFSFKDNTLLMQSFEFQKENPKEKFDVVAETLRRFMGQGPVSKAEGYTATSTDPKTKKAYEEILIDMSVPGPTLPQVTETTMAELGKKLGVTPAFDDPGNYMFPLMFTLGKNTYMLQGVGDQMNNKSFGESMIKSIVGTGKYINVGQKAKYTLVPDKLTTGTISSIGLNKDVSEKYIAYSNKTARLPFEPAIEEVEVVQPEVMQETQVETTPEIIEDALAKVEISSNAKGLAAALTNPTELAKSKGNLSQSYPIYYQWLNNEGEAEDGNFKDVEEAYQELKDNREAKTRPSREDSKNYRLMVELITAKLQQHPRLATEITKAGGSKWIMNATHQPTKQNTVWETGGQNWFILALNDAYAKVTSAPVEVEQTDTANEMAGTDDATSMLGEMFAQMQEQAQTTTSQVNDATIKLSTPEKPIFVYSDGSDIKGTGRLGFGAVFENGGVIYDLSGTEESAEVKRLAQMHPDAKFSNPTMEMLALVSVLNTFKNKAEHIVINQDYTGAVNYDGLWQKAEGSAQRQPKPWKAKEAYIKTLVDAGVRIIDQIEKNGGSVRINWVKGHSGNRMNDLADRAAKSREIFNNIPKAYDNENKTILDMQNLNMTAAVLDTLYEQSSKRMTKDAFSKAATEMVINMRATTTPENILEKIKCL
jgi:ribonuclease HI